MLWWLFLSDFCSSLLLEIIEKNSAKLEVLVGISRSIALMISSDKSEINLINKKQFVEELKEDI